MKAIILAAGSSKRLRPITDTIPKSLIEVEGKTLIERNIDILFASGVKEIIIVIGYLKKKIVDRLSKLYENISFIENPIYASSGSGYSLYLAAKTIKGSEPVAFMDADIIYHPAIVQNITEKPDRSFLYVGLNHCDEEAVKVAVNDTGAVIAISKTLKTAAIPIGESIGIVRLNKTDIAKILNFSEKTVNSGNMDFEWEHILDDHISDFSVGVKTTTLPWTEIDFPADIVKAGEVLKRFRFVRAKVCQKTASPDSLCY